MKTDASEELFRKNQGSREKLRQLLDDPILKEAFRIAGEKAKPHAYPPIRPGAHYDTVTSQRFSELHGRQWILNFIEDLTEPTTEMPELPNEAEFLHALPPQMQEALKKQQQHQ